MRTDGSDVPVGTTSDPDRGSTMEFGAIKAQLRFLQGDVLTIIEASFSDTEQRKAVKDLVSGAFKRRIDWFQELCFGSDSPRGVIIDSGVAPIDQKE